MIGFRVKKYLIFTACLGCAFVSANAASATIMLGNFTAGDKTDWEEQVFQGKTEYTFTPGKKGERALQVRSAAAASGLHKKMTIDLSKTPYLNWAWKIDNTLKGLDETTKKGDDYPVRLYVVVSGGLKFWKSEALNYVWSSTARAPNATWPNAYTESVIMVAVDSGESNVGVWVTHKRNLREDLKRYFGKDIDRIDAVALMVDTDNSGQKAVSYYGNIFMSSE